MVGGARHEVGMPVEPDRHHVGKAVPQAELAADAAVVRLVAARIRIPHVTHAEEQLRATHGRDVVHEPDVNGLVRGAALRCVCDVRLEREVGHQVHAGAGADAYGVADGEGVVRIEVGGESADLDGAALLGSRGERSGEHCSGNKR